MNIQKSKRKENCSSRSYKDLFVDINDICVKWLKNNHKDLFLKYNENKEDEYHKNNTLLSDSMFRVESRKEMTHCVKKCLKRVIVQEKEGEVCMSQTGTLSQYIGQPKLIGVGFFGNIYGGYISKYKIQVAIKESRIKPSQFTKAVEKQYPMEHLFNKLINDLIDGKVCPNFIITYAIFYCNNCTVLDIHHKTPTIQCSEKIMEKYDFNMLKVESLSPEVIWSILFQLLFALASIQNMYGLFHNNIKKSNILLRIIPPGGCWVYKIDHEEYFVPNYGYIVALNDFAMSHTFKPGFSVKNYGQRQAEVVESNGKHYFRPFITKKYPITDKNGRIISVQPARLRNTTLTINKFLKDFNSEPSIQIDLDNMGKFPPYLFHLDIIDCIQIFTDGKISSTIKSLNNFYMVEYDQPWPKERVDLFLAHHTIKKLFSSYRKIRSTGPKIEEYILKVATK